MIQKKNLFEIIFAITFGIFFAIAISLAWTEPSQPPPYGNIAAPLNVGPNAQAKLGGLVLNWGGATTGLIVATGNVGIGITEPNNRLQVIDLINFNNTDFNTFLGYQAGKNISPGASYNTFIGYQAGFRSTISASNTAIGYQALYFNVTGSGNTALGSSALFKNTTGYFNTALGYRALYSNATGSYNIALGSSALYSNATGSGNTALGIAALYSNTTGSYNTALGFHAGRYIADGMNGNATSTNSVYLGAHTKASFSGATNEIVIGYDAVGAGSNSVVLGNDSITKTILKGNVGIGTTTPGYRLDVVGDVRWTGTLQGGSVPWARLTSFPRGCTSGQFVTAIGSFLTCGQAVSGSGSTTYLAKWIGSTTLGNSIIYDNGINVGIGTTTPGAKLEVNGTLKVNESIILSKQITGTGDTDTFIKIVKAQLNKGEATVSCPPGYVVFGGGFQEISTKNDDQDENYPKSTTEWKCKDDDSSGYCYVICGKADASLSSY